jgi:hypothetical protein
LEEVKHQEEVIKMKKKEIDTKNITRAAPLMGYKEQNKFHAVNGTGTIQEITCV